jgi:hypothetical protein
MRVVAQCLGRLRPHRRLITNIVLVVSITCGVHAESLISTQPVHHVDAVIGNSGLCNSVAFSQLQGDPDLFLGRIRPGNPLTCDRTPWTLGVFQMRWSDYRLHFLHPALDLPAKIGVNMELTYAYDPHTAELGNETWVAFECFGRGISTWSTCIAPLDLRTDRIEVDRLTVAVSSIVKAGAPTRYSASDPKLFASGGALYLYWSVVEIRVSPRTIERISVRGMSLAEEPRGLRRMWGTGSGGRSVFSTDPRLSTEVAAPEVDNPNANMTVDIYDIKYIAGRIVALGGVGGDGTTAGQDRCGTPLAANEGCFRLAILAAQKPLSPLGFCRILPNAIVPRNPQEYSRFVTRPDGSLAIMGMYDKPIVKQAAAVYFPVGLYIYGINAKTLSGPCRRS